MEQLFLSIYSFFHKRKYWLYCLFGGCILLFAWGASQLKTEEDISKFFPDDARTGEFMRIFQNSGMADRLVVMLSAGENSTDWNVDSLVVAADSLASHLTLSLGNEIPEFSVRIDDSKFMSLLDIVVRNMPLFLDANDYVQLDSLTQQSVADSTLKTNYRQLISPTGMFTKNVIVKDPFGFSFLLLNKMKQLQYDENFELYDNIVFSKDHSNLLFFLRSPYPSNQTGNNLDWMKKLDTSIESFVQLHPQVEVAYFGGAAVAAGNAAQIRTDSLLTITLTVVLLVLVLVGFYKRKRVFVFLLIPVLFGALFSLFAIALLKGSISILAIAAGSVILGVGVNYSIHFITHLKYSESASHTIKALVKPLTLGSFTTITAFFCLQFANASVLRDMGLFAGFSLIGAALCTLIFLPHFVHKSAFSSAEAKPNWIEKLAMGSFMPKRFFSWVVLICTPILLYFSQSVKFNSDMKKLNFMKPELRIAENKLETLTKTSLSATYVLNSAANLENALRLNERSTSELNSLKATGDITSYTSVSSFLVSDSLQSARIERWNEFWTPAKKSALGEVMNTTGRDLKFSETVFQNFDSLVSRNYERLALADFNALKETFFKELVMESPQQVHIVSLVKVAEEKRETTYQKLNEASIPALDRQMMTNRMVELVQADFVFIVSFTSLLVFFALLISYGRIELALIAFIPMLTTWIWILGIMALVGIEFNIVNVMVSTFIFGLGDDYSIFTMDSLQKQYQFGQKESRSVQTSILLSAITTVLGLGVLIFAQHPALRSIAAISIIGITCVFLMSQLLQPLLFRWLIAGRTERKRAPMTMSGLTITFVTFSVFVFGALLLSLIGLLFRIIPLAKRKARYAYHTLIQFFSRFILLIGINNTKKTVNRGSDAFSRAEVVIANHSSFLDILLLIALHPKLILLTNKWVWNSPLFGMAVRTADYYPVMDGAEESVHKLKKLTDVGYSIVVFPEGTRSPDGRIHRFHKGAFYLSETLGIPIKPILIHGAGDGIPKNDFYINPGQLSLKFLSSIEPGNAAYGSGYSERTKSISKFFKTQHNAFSRELETGKYFRHKLISNYIYKGPVLEWYLRVKLRLENYYDVFHDLIPNDARILDLGCGYGFLCFMLSLRGEARDITGVDYDAEKIETAANSFLTNDKTHFEQGDVTSYDVRGYDVIVIADVLHYLLPEQQDDLINRCLTGLNPGGILIVRDGDRDLIAAHSKTKLTELFSVKLLGFNKSKNPLTFVSGKHMENIARENNAMLTIIRNSQLTSNTIFVFKREN